MDYCLSWPLPPAVRAALEAASESPADHLTASDRRQIRRLARGSMPEWELRHTVKCKIYVRLALAEATAAMLAAGYRWWSWREDWQRGPVRMDCRSVALAAPGVVLPAPWRAEESEPGEYDRGSHDPGDPSSPLNPRRQRENRAI